MGKISGTYLVLNHGVADIFDQAVELFCILGVVEETLDLALLFNRLEFFVDVVQFPDYPCLSDSAYNMGEGRPTLPRHFSGNFP